MGSWTMERVVVVHKLQLIHLFVYVKMKVCVFSRRLA